MRISQPFRLQPLLQPLVVCLILLSTVRAQTEPKQLKPVLDAELTSSDVVTFQMSQYLVKKILPLRVPESAERWATESQTLKNWLQQVVFHGWPSTWINAPLRVEDFGSLPSGRGYRMRKLRYEIVPGFWSTAILYLPEKIEGRIPAVLNVNGHVGHEGKAVDYKQKRCINQALQGMIALNLEWIGMGELQHPENQHSFGAHLDLVGANAIGLFYLAMRRGLDYLAEHPQVDRLRIGMTGLSGGGWQTIILSALDDRVVAAVPNAGFASLWSRLERSKDVGDVEQNATDLLVRLDYPHLVAMRAPRATLLIYNAEDNCCFRAPLVKPYIFEAVRPFFRLSGNEKAFEWHENLDPATHNYELDNRLQSYRFFARRFHLPEVAGEVPVGNDLKSFEELAVGLPNGNLTILRLARQLAGQIRHGPPNGKRLSEILRYREVQVERSWAIANTKNKGLETRSYRFDFSDGLGATGVRLKSMEGGATRAATVIINDKGKAASAQAVSERVNRGEEVLAVDLIFTGDAAPKKPPSDDFTQLLSATGDRPLGLEAAQLLSLARWLREATGVDELRLETFGLRSQVVGLAAMALQPGLFGEAVVRGGATSLGFLLDSPVGYQDAPDLFCLDLYKEFDLNGLAKLAAPTRVTDLGKPER